jgi:tetratricopeptide (TPR) repeat protein
MRNGLLFVSLMTALLMLGAGGSAHAQAVPDAPQPQKKTSPDKPAAEKPAVDKPAPPASPKDENAFPEAASKDAAKAAQTPDPQKPSAQENPFPEAVSKDAAKAGQTPDPKKPSAQENPFPESQSRDAAKAAGNDPEPGPAPKRDLPPGVSSSQADDVNGTAAYDTPDPARARKDADVGGFYLKNGDYQGALLRYKDAMAADPTNVDVIFGLAETQRMLKKNAEAARSYQLYLDVVPNGPKAKQALKALKALGSGQ